MEQREEIVQEIPEQMTEVRSLLAQVRRPEPQAGLGPPLHPGLSVTMTGISRLSCRRTPIMWASC
jgi:hypothetical protein